MQIPIKTAILSMMLSTVLPADAVVIRYNHNQAGGVSSRYFYSEIKKVKSRSLVDESSAELISNNKVTVYPTVVDNSFTIEIMSSENRQEFMTYSIFSANGQIVLCGNLETGSNTVIFQDYPYGMYLVKIVCGTECSTYKIIKK